MAATGKICGPGIATLPATHFDKPRVFKNDRIVINIRYTCCSATMMGIAIILSLTGVFATQPACDVRTQTPAEYCEDYCTNECSFYNTSLGKCANSCTQCEEVLCIL